MLTLMHGFIMNSLTVRLLLYYILIPAVTSYMFNIKIALSFALTFVAYFALGELIEYLRRR